MAPLKPSTTDVARGASPKRSAAEAAATSTSGPHIRCAFASSTHRAAVAASAAAFTKTAWQPAVNSTRSAATRPFTCSNSARRSSPTHSWSKACTDHPATRPQLFNASSNCGNACRSKAKRTNCSKSCLRADDGVDGPRHAGATAGKRASAARRSPAPRAPRRAMALMLAGATSGAARTVARWASKSSHARATMNPRNNASFKDALASRPCSRATSRQAPTSARLAVRASAAERAAMSSARSPRA
mmetsp:Transcript_39478/g.114290  ORF Transcript_39478/g.114290 Transcript_39478/m.114290 type:complete len:245 (+) Transcript_39478:1813-2547(+)